VKKFITFFVSILAVLGTTLSLSAPHHAFAQTNTTDITGETKVNLVAKYPLKSIDKSTLATIHRIDKKDTGITLKQEDGNLIITQQIDKDVDLFVKSKTQEAKVNPDRSFTVKVPKNTTNNTLTLTTTQGEILTSKNIKGSKKVNIVKNMDFGSYIDDMENMMSSTNDKSDSDTSMDMSNMDTNSDIDSSMDMSNMDANSDNDSSTDKSNMDATNSSIQSNSLTVVSLAYKGQTYSGQPVKKGTHVHCNRFNGPNSDHKCWNKINPKAWVDFWESDCDYHATKYGCSDFGSMSKCDGLNVKGKGVKDCSSWSGGAAHHNWPKTAWYRN
jgi:hypothetical protein